MRRACAQLRAASILRPMATSVSRPGLELRVRSLASARIVVFAGLALLVYVSWRLKTAELDVGYWVDEGLSVGIADRPLLDIPGILRQDGSPPLYYMLLHVWMSLTGSGEQDTHTLSLLFALAAVPVAFWGAGLTFGRRAAWFAAVLTALNPFLSQYAQETRMYSLVVLLSMLATSLFLRAYTGDERPARRWPVLFGARARGHALHAQLGALPRHGDGHRVARPALPRAARGAPGAAARRRCSGSG